MPTSKHTTPKRRSLKSSHWPSETTHIAPKIPQSTTITPNNPLLALLK